MFLAFLASFLLLSVGLVCIVAKEKPYVNAGRSLSYAKSLRLAFHGIITGIKKLPQDLAVFTLVMYLTVWGYASYSGAKAQFFGLEVMHGDAYLADQCGDTCSPAQKAYNDGTQLAGGLLSIFSNLVGFFFSFALSPLINRFGATYVLAASILPQSLLMISTSNI
jgi:solute carrier family 45, member 1/2/4